MTTSVTIDAHAGWPVDVKFKNPKTGAVDRVTRVEPNTKQTFAVHNGADIEIHEVQRDETTKPE